MALRLVRKTSDTPSVTNKDDCLMTRYAYGGYNGVVKGFGSSCEYSIDGGKFTIQSGRIVIDGWEVDIDGAGQVLDLSGVSGNQYHSVYAELNVATESISIKSSYLTGSFPTINEGDDLSQAQNGTARLLLYQVLVTNGIIKHEFVHKRFKTIPYVKDIEESLAAIEVGLSDGSFAARNALTLKFRTKIEATADNCVLTQTGLYFFEGFGFVYWSGDYVHSSVTATEDTDKLYLIEIQRSGKVKVFYLSPKDEYEWYEVEDSSSFLVDYYYLG